MTDYAERMEVLADAWEMEDIKQHLKLSHGQPHWPTVMANCGRPESSLLRRAAGELTRAAHLAGPWWNRAPRSAELRNVLATARHATDVLDASWAAIRFLTSEGYLGEQGSESYANVCDDLRERVRETAEQISQFAEEILDEDEPTEEPVPPANDGGVKRVYIEAPGERPPEPAKRTKQTTEA